MSEESRSAREAAMFVVHRLHDAGHVALFAGGCVRDQLLGAEPKDFDVATDAVPDRVRELFPRARIVGAKFGVVLARKYGHSIEVATFRSDGSYSDGRHPDSVQFGNDREDAARRDFTINGLFLNPLTDEVIDYVGGREDLARCVVRTIGDPERRFAEDHLRMLRAVRFAARLSFEIDAGTMEAIRRNAALLPTISAERIWMELELILTEPSRARGWALLLESGLRESLSSDWPANRAFDERATMRLGGLPGAKIDASLGLAAVLAEWSAERIESIAASLKSSNRLSRAVSWLVTSLKAVVSNPDMELADLKTLLADEEWSNLMHLLHAEAALLSTGPQLESHISARAVAIAPERVAPPPFVSGYDLAALGFREGPRFGEILKAAYRAQLNEQVTNKDEALNLVRHLISQGN